MAKLPIKNDVIKDLSTHGKGEKGKTVKDRRHLSCARAVTHKTIQVLQVEKENKSRKC
jgi:hypothetical protein